MDAMKQFFTKLVREDKMRIALVVLMMALMALWNGPAASAQDRAERLSESGVAVAVGWEEGTLLVQNSQSFSLLVMDAAAVISDSQGAALTLAEIRPGDHVTYTVETWAGMSIAIAVQVTSPH